MQFILDNLICGRWIQGGLQIDVSYAMLVVIFLFVAWRVWKFAKWLNKFLSHVADFFRGEKKDSPRVTIS